MTGGGGVMTTSASIGVIYSALQTPSLGLRGRKGERGRKRGERRKAVKGGGKKGEGRKKERVKKEEREGERGRERWYPTFWYKVTPVLSAPHNCNKTKIKIK